MRLNTALLGPLSLDEYLRLEETSDRRHEFVAGRVYEMFGTTARHNRIALNIVKRLDVLGAGTPCRSYALELKVQASADRVYYPDVVMVCEAHDGESVMFDAPCFIVEITSRSTRRTDRGEKLDAYLRLPSLRGYLVVEQDRRHVTLYTRAESGWQRDEFVGSGCATVPCVDGELSLDDVYAGVEPKTHIREGDDSCLVEDPYGDDLDAVLVPADEDGAY